MKTILVIYILAFVSIIVVYVHDHRSAQAQAYFDPYEAVAGLRTVEAPPDSFETEGTAASPEPVTVAPAGTGEDREPAVEDEFPHTFEGLDRKIGKLREDAITDPEKNIEIAEAYNIKADMYRAAIEALAVLEAQTDDRREKQKLHDRRELLEAMRIKSLWQAIGVLKKVPGNVYENTDVRWLRAMTYLGLPNQHPRAIAELRKLADDPRAIPKLREQARSLVEKYKKISGE